MVYVTATFPYLVILTLVIWGATLDGSLDGVRFYLSLDWSRLQSPQVTLQQGWGFPDGSDPPSWCQWGRLGWGVLQPPPPPIIPQVWSDAASQIFYSLCIGFGGLVSMASYNEFDNNVIQ